MEIASNVLGYSPWVAAIAVFAATGSLWTLRDTPIGPNAVVPGPGRICESACPIIRPMHSS
jgi:hypothetical protein